MPELPEVETVRRGLESRILGGTVTRVRLDRPDYVRHGSTSARAMLRGATITALIRRGKRLAILADDGRALDLHLGMSGQVLTLTGRQDAGTHAHATWWITAPDWQGRVVMRDPRRFGCLRTHASHADLEAAWASLGPDALTVRASTLQSRLGRSRAAIKTKLLDQHAVAGIGNIYADESLFRARIHPASRCCDLNAEAYAALGRAVRLVLRRGIERGGSTLSDFVDIDGQQGGYQQSHTVYGRAGEPCRRCRTHLEHGLFAQRTTVWCPRCQRIEKPKLST